MSKGPSAQYWRDKAEESRAMAAAMTDLRVSATLRGIAADYEKLAGFAEQIEASKAAINQSGEAEKEIYRWHLR